MGRRQHGTYFASNAEQLFEAVPASGRDVDIANFFARRFGGASDYKDELADLLAAYRVEQEEKLEARVSELQDTVERLQDELNDWVE